jgi:hypothetical protein
VTGLTLLLGRVGRLVASRHGALQVGCCPQHLGGAAVPTVAPVTHDAGGVSMNFRWSKGGWNGHACPFPRENFEKGE